MLTRSIRQLFLFLLICTSLPALADPLSFLKETPEFLPVEQAFEFNAEVIEPGKIEVFWTIADGYYLYKDKLELDAGSIQFANNTLPAGKPHEDEFFGTTEVYYNNLLLNLSYESSEPGQLVITYMGCAEAGLCYPPTKQKISLPAALPQTISQVQTAQEPMSESSFSAGSQSDLASKLSSGNTQTTLILFFLLGLGLAFTPCVFPMYPILSAAISGGSQLRKSHAFALSFTYVQGMALTYTLLGLLVASFGVQLQAAFQHPAVLIFLSVLFAGLALSMFGAFNLQLPQRWQNALHQKSSHLKGGRLGSVFLLGVIAGLVASPCTTAPLSAALLYVGQSGDLALGALSLYVLSLGMGLPLLVIGTLGGQLLPKTGSWMNIVKHLLGFVTLAVPVFLLERLLPEAMSLSLWALLLISTGSYLVLILRQTKLSTKTLTAYLLAVLLITSGGYLANHALHVPSHEGSANTLQPSQEQNNFIQLTSLSEIELAITEAAAKNQPVLIDFYADWCVACKEFDKYTFPDAEVKERLSEMVLIRLDVTHSTTQDIEIMEHYQILGLPTLLLFNAQGEELTQHRIAGFLKAQPFIAHLNRAFAAN